MASFFRSKGKNRNKNKEGVLLNAPLEYANQTLAKSFDTLVSYRNLNTAGLYDTSKSTPIPPFDIEYPEDPDNMSLSEANTIIKKQQSRISDLENIIRERDSEIEQLKANLDMTRLVSSHYILWLSAAQR